MTIQPPVILDVVTRVTPFGVRFFDAVTRRFVNDLAVIAVPDAHPEQRFSLAANASAVYVMQNLPGLRKFEYGSGDEEFWAHMPATQPYSFTVTDPLRRFLPFTFQADVPARGLFKWMHGPTMSPPSGISDVPLFSAPNRDIPEGMAVVRADLVRLDAPAREKPAAWAMLEISYEGRVLGWGMANPRGSVVVIFPYPNPVDLLPLSPMATGISPWDQQWPLDFSVAFVPGPDRDAPDLAEATRQLERPRATAWQDASQAVSVSQDTLKFARELILRSLDETTHLPLSSLWITPAP